MKLSERIQTLRKEKGITQASLAKLIQISVPQLVRYETKDVQPTADTLRRLSTSLEVSIDFLVNGTLNEKATNTISDNKLLSQFKAVEQMNDEDKSVVLKLIDAFITKKQIQKLSL